MGRKHLLPQEHDDYLTRLGLTEQDAKIYIATLDSGLSSVGEIQQLTEIDDLSKVLESVRDLVDIGLIKKAQGRMPRYYAVLPFLRETMTIEKEFDLALESMIVAVNQSKEELNKNRENLIKTEFPKYTQKILDKFYEKFLSPTIDNFKNLSEVINKLSDEQKHDIENQNTAVLEEIRLMLKPLFEYSDEFKKILIQQLSSIGDKINDLIKNNENNRIEVLKTSHDDISVNLTDLKKNSGIFQKSSENSISKLQLISTSLIKLDQQIASIQPKIENSIKEENKLKDNLLNEISSQSKNLIKFSNKEIKTDDDKLKGKFQKEIENSFEKLISFISGKNLDPKILQNNLNEAIKLFKDGSGLLNNIQNELSGELIKTTSQFSTSIENISTSLSNNLNKLNDYVSSNINQLRENIKSLHENEINDIEYKNKEILERINSHQLQIEENHKLVGNKWKERIGSLMNEPSNKVISLLEGWVDEIKPEIDEFNNGVDQILTTMLDPILTIEKENITQIVNQIAFVKAMLDARNRDLQSIITFSKSFDYIKSSDTWVVVGLQSIYATLTDLLLRTKLKVTVVTPNIDLELIEIANKIISQRSMIRITFVTDIDKEADARIIRKYEDVGQITLRAYDKRDLYACIRDDEEMIFGYISENEETIGIRTSTPSMVALLTDRINETVIRNSKQVS